MMFVFAPPATTAQTQSQEGSRSRVLDNFDIAPSKTVVSEAAKESKIDVEAKPAKKATIKVESPSKTTKVTTKNVSKKANREEVAALPPIKGEGYWRGDLSTETSENEELEEAPKPRVYSELRSSIDDSGKLILTSDTIVEKPVVKIETKLKATESTGNTDLDQIINRVAQKTQIDPRLIVEVMRQESGFRNTALSNKGAQGLMQLIPATAARFGVYKVWEPEQNIQGGARYLRFLLDKFSGNLELALAGYNAGEGAVMKYNYTVPPYRETRDYVRSITARYRSKYHQTYIAKKEPVVVRTAPLMTFAAENGRVILSNNY